MTVPMVSKKSLMSSENTNRSNSGCANTCTMAKVPVAGSTWKGAAKAARSSPNSQLSGKGVTPKGTPTAVAATMERINPPLTFAA